MDGYIKNKNIYVKIYCVYKIKVINAVLNKVNKGIINYSKNSPKSIIINLHFT
jgi:hypothetical protein